MSRVLMLLLLATLASCVTYQKCADKFGTVRDSVKVRVAVPYDTTVFIPGDSLKGSINLDTLCANWYYWNTTITDSLVVLADSVVRANHTTRLETKHWIDKYNRALMFNAVVKPDTIHIRDTVYVQANCPPVVEFKNKDASGFRALWQGYQLFAAWALLVLIAVLIFLTRIKNLFK